MTRRLDDVPRWRLRFLALLAWLTAHVRLVDWIRRGHYTTADAYRAIVEKE